VNVSEQGQDVRVARIIQVTDCHLGPTPEYALARVRTFYSLKETLARIGAEAISPDLVMVTGDVAAKGSLEAYGLFAGVMQDTGFNYAWLPGNHDDFSILQESLASGYYWPQLDMGPWRLYSLNTAVAGEVGGYLEQAELTFLDQSLTREPQQPAVIFMHHPPVNIGCAWLDRQQVGNAGALEALLHRHPQVKLMFTGHVHQACETTFAGVPLFTTPSSCFQFLAKSDTFALAGDPPGYRWIDLYTDGRWETGVVEIVDTREKVDTNIQGY
jgi:Icc protein